MTPSADDYEVLRATVRQELGIELGPSRQAMVRRRLNRLPDADAVLEAVRQGTYRPADLVRLANVLTTNHTHWGREAGHFDVLTRWIDEQPAGRLRLWCAASSTGEEPYSLWMACQDSKRGAAGVAILATDISSHALEAARRGVYEAPSIEPLKPHWRTRWFQRISPDEVQVVETARKHVLFRRLNLMTHPLPFRNPLDAIFCRNVVIYFEGDDRRAVVQRQVDRLRPGGLYCFGMAESLPKGVEGLERIGPSAYRKVER